MNEQEMKDFSIKLMQEANVTCFTTMDETGYPHTRAIFNLRNIKQFPTLAKIFENQKEDLLIYISTNTSSTKVKHIRTNTAVSLCFTDPEDFRGLTLGGDIEIVTDETIKKELWLDWWNKYYPKGIEDEDYTILMLQPKTVEVWYKGKFKFQFT